MRTADIEKWRGHRDPVPLDPAVMTFRAQLAGNKCRGCAFDGQWSSVCKCASELAKAAGLADCDDGVIYVVADPCQLDILGAATGECGSPAAAITDKTNRENL